MTYHWEEEKLGAAYDAAIMRRLLTYVKPYTKLFILCFGLIVVITLCELTLPYLTKIAIDQYIRPGRLGGLYLLAAIFVGILVIRLIASFAQVYLLQLSGQKIMRDMRTQIFDHLMKLPTKFFDRNLWAGSSPAPPTTSRPSTRCMRRSWSICSKTSFWSWGSLLLCCS
jgi:ATP-binding cassette subfamily B multidrug efflux pump